MEAASRFELENVGFAGRFKHITAFYPKLHKATKTPWIISLQIYLFTLTYPQNPVYLCQRGEIGGENEKA